MYVQSIVRSCATGIQNPGLPNSTSWAWSDSNEICPCFYALHGSMSQGRLGGQSRCSYLWYCNGISISISFLGCFLKSPELLKMQISFTYSFSAQNKVPKKPSPISEVLPLLCALGQSHVQPRKAGLSSGDPPGRLLFPTPLLFLAQHLQSPPSTEGHSSLLVKSLLLQILREKQWLSRQELPRISDFWSFIIIQLLLHQRNISSES